MLHKWHFVSLFFASACLVSLAGCTRGPEPGRGVIRRAEMNSAGLICRRCAPPYRTAEVNRPVLILGVASATPDRPFAKTAEEGQPEHRRPE